jgi:hypothetical protein
MLRSSIAENSGYISSSYLRLKFVLDEALDFWFSLCSHRRLRLGGDPADDEYPDKPPWMRWAAFNYPDKPPRMRWATYNRLLDKLRAADGVADERLRRVLINAQISGFRG